MNSRRTLQRYILSQAPRIISNKHCEKIIEEKQFFFFFKNWFLFSFYSGSFRRGRNANPI